MSKQAVNIHDAFFKNVMSDPNIAAQFLREHLPRDVARLLSAETPELLSGSFVDEDLRQHQSDLLFRIRLATGTEAFAYVLVEHKSSPDSLTRLQLLRYVTRVLTNWHRHNRRLPLPPIVPLVAHHGPGAWTVSHELAELFEPVPGPLRPYLPSLRHALVDLARVDDSALSHHIRLRAFLKALKYILRPDLSDHLDILFAELPALDLVDAILILTYIDKGPVAVRARAMQAALDRVAPGRKEEIMGHFSQEFFDEGMAKGEAKGMANGIAKGELKGEAKALTRLLEKRFGALPPHLGERISTADVQSIENWFDRAIDAPDLASVFGS